MAEQQPPKNNERQGAGRPKGSKNKARFATKKLEALELTPLVEILTLLNNNDIRIANADRENSIGTTYTGDLLKHRGTILRSLLPYQYSPMREEEVVTVLRKEPIGIKLTLPSAEVQKKEPDDEWKI